MPSDERVEVALKELSEQTTAFRSAIANTIEQIRSFRASHGSNTNGKADRVAAELGPFAANLIDVEKFSALFADNLKLDSHTLDTIDKAVETLSELSRRGNDLFKVNVESGGSLRESVAAVLEDVGRAYGAARVFELSKFGKFPDNDHARALGSFPFHRWSRGERLMAPPLTVEVYGSDLRASGLADFMDGRQKIVLVVRGESTPVPLVRLITPGVFVQQTSDPIETKRLAAWDGPGVTALVPESAAKFVHDPSAGRGTGERLSIQSLPEDRRRKPIGGVSVAQQSEELLQLKVLAGQPVATAPAGASESAASVSGAADPVDKLAAWLLSQADLKDLG